MPRRSKEAGLSTDWGRAPLPTVIGASRISVGSALLGCTVGSSASDVRPRSCMRRCWPLSQYVISTRSSSSMQHVGAPLCGAAARVPPGTTSGPIRGSRPHRREPVAQQKARFAFAITTGPNAGLACVGWRVWTKHEDTYITATSVGSKWKASLHADDCWRLALTSENERSANPMLVDGHKNAPWEFEPTIFEDGHRLAFAIAVTRAAFRPEPVPANETVIPIEDRWDRLPIAYVRMTEPGVQLAPEQQLVAGPLPLASGRQVWVTAGSEETSPAEPEPIPAGTMIKPLVPAVDKVTAPGLIVVAVNVG